MKKYGKLIIAFMWLGLTMIMIVGATFAWFSENRNVEANGMSVQAEASKNLLISSDNSNFAISASSAITSVTKLTPSSTTNLSSFFKATSNTKESKVNYATGALLDGAVMESAAVTTANPASADTVVDVVKHTFYIKVDGIADATLYRLSVENITVTGAANDISKALRIGIKCDNNYFIYSITGGDTNNQGITSTEAAKGAVSNARSTVAGTDVLSSTIVVGTTKTVEIFVWYEGEDSNCTSAKSVNVETLSIVVKFKAYDTAE